MQDPVANPAHIVEVVDFSPDTLRRVIAHLAVSTDFEHLVYREAELDAIWSLTGFHLRSEGNAAKRDAVHRLRNAVHLAHDLVGEKRPDEARDRLVEVQASLGDQLAG